MKRLMLACLLITSLVTKTDHTPTSGQTQAYRTPAPIGQPQTDSYIPLFGQPYYYIIFATVSEVDTETWRAYCTDSSGQVYTFEVEDEWNAGDHVRAVAYYDGKNAIITEAHY